MQQHVLWLTDMQLALQVICLVVAWDLHDGKGSF